MIANGPTVGSLGHVSEMLKTAALVAADPAHAGWIPLACAARVANAYWHFDRAYRALTAPATAPNAGRL